MISLSDAQLQIVMHAAAVPVEKRDVFRRRVSAMLVLRGRHFTDDDVTRVTALALNGMIHAPAA
jgi:hypothetical protein